MSEAILKQVNRSWVKKEVKRRYKADPEGNRISAHYDWFAQEHGYRDWNVMSAALRDENWTISLLVVNGPTDTKH